jgi:hypothetical protein
MAPSAIWKMNFQTVGIDAKLVIAKLMPKLRMEEKAAVILAIFISSRETCAAGRSAERETSTGCFKCLE